LLAEWSTQAWHPVDSAPRGKLDYTQEEVRRKSGTLRDSTTAHWNVTSDPGAHPRTRQLANQCVVAPLSVLTIKELTLTGSKSARVTFVKQERSSSFQRLSGVPINPPVWPLSARILPSQSRATPSS
jgi:hypothetical protein